MDGRTIGPNWSGFLVRDFIRSGTWSGFWSGILLGPVLGPYFWSGFRWSGTWSGIRSENPVRISKIMKKSKILNWFEFSNNIKIRTKFRTGPDLGPVRNSVRSGIGSEFQKCSIILNRSKIVPNESSSGFRSDKQKFIKIYLWRKVLNNNFRNINSALDWG